MQHKILMNLNFSTYLNLEDAFILVVVLESGDTFQFRDFLYIWAQQSVKENGMCVSILEKRFWYKSLSQLEKNYLFSKTLIISTQLFEA